MTPTLADAGGEARPAAGAEQQLEAVEAVISTGGNGAAEDDSDCLVSVKEIIVSSAADVHGADQEQVAYVETRAEALSKQSDVVNADVGVLSEVDMAASAEAAFSEENGAAHTTVSATNTVDCPVDVAAGNGEAAQIVPASATEAISSNAAVHVESVPAPPPPTENVPVSTSSVPADQVAGIGVGNVQVLFALGDRVVHDAHGEGLVWALREGLMGVVFDDLSTPWTSFMLVGDAGPVPVRRVATDVNERNNDTAWAALATPPSPLDLPVGGVILGKVGACNAAASRRCPSALLRGKASSGRAADCEANGWTTYLAYSPGVATNYGTPPLPFTFGFGQQILCTPPFLSACEGANVAPTPSEPVYGECIGIIIGEEQWQSTTRTGEKKTKTESRRFVLARIARVLCWVPFEKVGCAGAEPTSSQNALSLSEALNACYSAALVRKPSTVHGALKGAATKVNLERIALDATAAYEGTLSEGALQSLGNNRPNTRGRNATSCASSIINVDGAGALAEAAQGITNTSARSKTAMPASGVPIGLVNWNVSKLDTRNSEQLRLALIENGISPAPNTCTDKDSWAKEKLLRKFKGRGYPGFRATAPVVAAVEATDAPNHAPTDGRKRRASRGNKRRMPLRIDDDDDDDDDDFHDTVADYSYVETPRNVRAPRGGGGGDGSGADNKESNGKRARKKLEEDPDKVVREIEVEERAAREEAARMRLARATREKERELAADAAQHEQLLQKERAAEKDAGAASRRDKAGANDPTKVRHVKSDGKARKSGRGKKEQDKAPQESCDSDSEIEGEKQSSPGSSSSGSDVRKSKKYARRDVRSCHNDGRHRAASSPAANSRRQYISTSASSAESTPYHYREKASRLAELAAERLFIEKQRELEFAREAARLQTELKRLERKRSVDRGAKKKKWRHSR